MSVVCRRSGRTAGRAVREIESGEHVTMMLMLKPSIGARDVLPRVYLVRCIGR